MAVGNVLDYQPAPGGGYMFNVAGRSSPLLMAGPEAEQLKAKLDAAKSATAFAGPGAGDLGGIGNYGGGNEPPSPEQIQAFREQVQGGPGGAPAASPGPTPATPAPGGQLGYGLRVSPQGTIQKFQPGTRGVTKEQLQKAEENKVALSRGQTEVVQAGTPEDQAYLDSLAEGAVDKRLALDQEREQAKAAADEEAAAAAEAFKTTQRIAGEEAARQQELERRYKQEDALAQKAQAEYSASRVEPGRVFMNPIGGIASILAAAGGAYAATIAKTPNFAQQIIDQATDRDIRAQETAIRIKGDKANNLVANLRQIGMSRDQAIANAKAIQLQYQQAQLQAIRAKNKSPQLDAYYNNLDQGIQASLAEAQHQSKIAAVDKVTRSTQKGFESPRAGTAGGYVDVADQLGTAAKIQGLKKGEQELNKGEKPAAASPETRQAAGAVAETDVLADLASKYSANEGLPNYEARTIFGQTWEDFANKVAGQGAGISAETAVKRQDLARIQSGLASANSVLGGQGAMTGEEQKIFAAGMAPGATWGDVQRAIAMTNDRAKARGAAAQQVGEAGGNVVTK